MNSKIEKIRAVMDASIGTGKTNSFIKNLKDDDIVIVADNLSKRSINRDLRDLNENIIVEILTIDEFYTKYRKLLLNKNHDRFESFNTISKFNLKIHHCVYDELLYELLKNFNKFEKGINE